MVSPGKLQLLAELADGTVDAYQPTIDRETEQLRYPEAERFLHDREGPAGEVLEELARWGLLDESFQEKVYLCPGCGTDDLRYTTACPSCGSLHVVETEVVHHTDCGHTAPRAEFASEGDLDVYVCSGCDETVTVPDEGGTVLDEIEVARRHVCRDCDGWYEAPTPRLNCPQCPPVVPSEAVEWVLYRYELAAAGEAWLDRQLSARQAIVEALADRGFETRVDTTVGDGPGVPVHVYAEDALLDRRVVAGMAEQPDVEDVRAVQEAATAADARGMLLATTGTVTERAAAAARETDVDLLSRRSDDGLERHYETTEGSDDTRNLLQRLTSAVTGEP